VRPTNSDTDAALAKMKLNWRTALVIAELEAEIEALAQGRQHRKLLKVRGMAGCWLSSLPELLQQGMEGPAQGRQHRKLLKVCGMAVRVLACWSNKELYRGELLYRGDLLSKSNLDWWSILKTRMAGSNSSLCASVLLQELLNKKDMVGDVFNQLRLARQRALNQSGVVRAVLLLHCVCVEGRAIVGAPRAAAALGRGVGRAVLANVPQHLPSARFFLTFHRCSITQPQVPLYEHLGPTASLDDEQEVNDTLGQLLMVMSVLDEQIGEAKCRSVGGRQSRVGHVWLGFGRQLLMVMSVLDEQIGESNWLLLAMRWGVFSF